MRQNLICFGFTMKPLCFRILPCILVLLLLSMLSSIDATKPKIQFSRVSKVHNSDKFDSQEVPETVIGSTQSARNSIGKQKEREQLYEAYNLLHTLAQVQKQRQF